MRLCSVAIWVALVLLCSGLDGAGRGAAATLPGIEVAAATALGAARDAVAGGEATSASEDAPAPWQAEGAQELPLLQTLPASAPPPAGSPWPRRPGLAAIQSPFLEGLQRPPRAMLTSA